jgi:hypothetical protein
MSSQSKKNNMVSRMRTSLNSSGQAIIADKKLSVADKSASLIVNNIFHAVDFYFAALEILQVDELPVNRTRTSAATWIELIKESSTHKKTRTSRTKPSTVPQEQSGMIRENAFTLM